ncbi:Ribosome biogenesis protein Alb1 [Penicillium cf. griseofulvum]|uniref:Ribosome biogenesis protein Alb1 n=1 Tax=Penicillium cf. griseofulvum TaxID=2972120 RepID=A0A9W9JPY4_9EURO|nr:Ribosome biogenesis protein Alb1 [Penicillium cf. griseofulvum]KAJ5423640.1 Ribosome biogenesis protein Alb1 [Penicillium cf. griseofulvum]KAJ5431107.1 Ribosome biogenesis protein Alb1 [Penicillium cf. griseofulvum]
MAKSKSQSQRSRAARRAASPSLDLDKSVLALPRAESPTTTRPSVLADRATAGIKKKQNKNDKISRAQRLRQQKGMDRAEAVMDQLEIKKAKSLARGKTVNSRRADWEDTNRKTLAFDALRQDDDDEDDEDDEAMAEDSAPSGIPVAKNVFQIPTEALIATEDSNLVTDDIATIDEADEIT